MDNLAVSLESAEMSKHGGGGAREGRHARSTSHLPEPSRSTFCCGRHLCGFQMWAVTKSAPMNTPLGVGRVCSLNLSYTRTFACLGQSCPFIKRTDGLCFIWLHTSLNRTLEATSSQSRTQISRGANQRKFRGAQHYKLTRGWARSGENLPLTRARKSSSLLLYCALINT